MTATRPIDARPADPLRLALWLMAASALVMAVFGALPQADLAVTALFYDGRRFPLNRNDLLVFAREHLWHLSLVGFGLCIAALALSAVARRKVAGLGARFWAFAVAFYLAGPALLANGILKEHWGRVRPADTLAFGGDLPFTPVHSLAGLCQSNCSFVSGEVSGSATFAIVAGLVLWAQRGRMPALAIGAGLVLLAALPALSTFQRVATGRHFLSDCLMAALLMAVLGALIYRALVWRGAGAARPTDGAGAGA